MVSFQERFNAKKSGSDTITSEAIRSEIQAIEDQLDFQKASNAYWQAAMVNIDLIENKVRESGLADDIRNEILAEVQSTKRRFADKKPEYDRRVEDADKKAAEYAQSVEGLEKELDYLDQSILGAHAVLQMGGNASYLRASIKSFDAFKTKLESAIQKSILTKGMTREFAKLEETVAALEKFLTDNKLRS